MTAVQIFLTGALIGCLVPILFGALFLLAALRWSNVPDPEG